MLAVLFGAVALLAVLISRRGQAPGAPEPVAGAPALAPQAAPAQAPAEITLEAPAIIKEALASEIRYLPGGVALPAAEPKSRPPEKEMVSTSRRLGGVAPLTSLEKDGPFIAPKLSPDGLQLLATRPGYQGVFLVDRATGEWRQLAEGEGLQAEWTPEGGVRVTDAEGAARLYGPDGALLEEGGAAQAAAPSVFAENDAIYLRRGEGGAPVALTGGEDRYFDPTLSPDGQYVVFQGLYSGLYLARADGSGSVIYLGEGNHPAWLPDSSGFVFDVTRDDGHHLLDGDVYFVDAAATERTNLTPGDSLIAQTPVVGPDGRTVIFEVNGQIYIGVLQ